MCVCLCASVCVVLTCPEILAVERPKCLCLSSWLHSAVAWQCVSVCGDCAGACFYVCGAHTCVLCFWTCVQARLCVIEGRESWKVSRVSVSVDLLQTPPALPWQLPVARSRPGYAGGVTSRSTTRPLTPLIPAFYTHSHTRSSSTFNHSAYYLQNQVNSLILCSFCFILGIANAMQKQVELLLPLPFYCQLLKMWETEKNYKVNKKSENLRQGHALFHNVEGAIYDIKIIH